MLGALFKTAEDCNSDFEANGLPAPGADGTGWLPAPLRAIPTGAGGGWQRGGVNGVSSRAGLWTGAALVELGMKCGVEARQRGCDVNTFGKRGPDAE